MSADNYVIVRKFDDGWRWGMFFASDDEPFEHWDGSFVHGPFETPAEADRDAREECCIIEYGVQIDWGSDVSPAHYQGGDI